MTGAHDFAEKLLSGQRQFAEERLKATTPLMAGDGSGTKPEPGAAAE